MMKAILLGLAAVVGSVVSCLVYLVIDIVFDLPLADYERDVWTEYGSRIFGAVGGIGGVVMGWTACVWINKPRMHVAAPSEIPPTEKAVQSRKNIRPLTWLNQAKPRHE